VVCLERLCTFAVLPQTDPHQASKRCANKISLYSSEWLEINKSELPFNQKAPVYDATGVGVSAEREEARGLGEWRRDGSPHSLISYADAALRLGRAHWFYIGAIAIIGKYY